VTRIDVEDSVDGVSPAFLRITGLKLAVNTAVLLIEKQLEFQEHYRRCVCAACRLRGVRGCGCVGVASCCANGCGREWCDS
jgi:hypothetical protein